MIIQEIRNIRSGKKELRKFGTTLGVVFVLLGALLWWRGRNYFSYFFMLSAVFILPGLIVPSVLKPVQKAWMTLAILMSWVMTRALLGLLFYTAFTLLGLGAKILGKDLLHLKFDKAAGSYWIPRERRKFEKSDYERQF